MNFDIGKWNIMLLWTKDSAYVWDWGAMFLPQLNPIDLKARVQVGRVWLHILRCDQYFQGISETDRLKWDKHIHKLHQKRLRKQKK